MNELSAAGGMDDGPRARQAAATNPLATDQDYCADLAEGDVLRVPLAREEFIATARPVRSGTVRIVKRVVTEDQVLEVPVTEEEIRVERRLIDRPDGESYEQIIIEVPLYRDRLDVQKRTRVSDELIVTKQITRRTEQIRDTVRREEAFVDSDARDNNTVIMGESTGDAS
jgi:uncharacterized protein (TIGR02271 family)